MPSKSWSLAAGLHTVTYQYLVKFITRGNFTNFSDPGSFP